MSNTAKLYSINQGTKSMPSQNGYVRLWRDIRKQPFWKKDLEAKSIFVELLMLAQHKTVEKPYKGVSVLLGAGQLIASRSKLSELSGVDSDSKVKRSLEKFEALGQISRSDIKNKGRVIGQIITILNYEKWQKIDQPTDQPSDQPQTAEIKAMQRGSDQPSDQPTDQHSNKLSNKRDLVSKDTCQNSDEFKPVRKSKVPYQEIMNLFGEILIGLPQPTKLTSKRKTHINARHKDLKCSVANWRKYFEYVRDNCQWMLTGQYSINFDYLINESNFANIVEGAKNDRA